jgi:hypothetical protein
MLVRCTAKALGLVGRAEFRADPPDDSNEWYLNLLWRDRRKCLLLVHAATLYPTFVPDVRRSELQPFGQWAVAAAADGLAEEGIHGDSFGLLDADSLITAKTASRRVLGCMNDMALHIDYLVHADGGLGRTDLDELTRHLRRTPYKIDGVWATPTDAAREHAGRLTSEGF